VDRDLASYNHQVRSDLARTSSADIKTSVTVNSDLARTSLVDNTILALANKVLVDNKDFINKALADNKVSLEDLSKISDKANKVLVDNKDFINKV